MITFTILWRLSGPLNFDIQDTELCTFQYSRRVFHVMSFFMFFFNIVVGLFSCLRRIVISLILGTLLVSRLDRCLLMPGFEDKDAGTTDLINTCLLFTNLYKILTQCNNIHVLTCFAVNLRDNLRQIKAKLSKIKFRNMYAKLLCDKIAHNLRLDINFIISRIWMG